MKNIHISFQIKIYIKRFFIILNMFKLTYHNNGEVKQCPETTEVNLEAERKPLEYHFQCKDGHKDEICIVQSVLEVWFGVQVHIFKCLERNNGIYHHNAYYIRYCL